MLKSTTKLGVGSAGVRLLLDGFASFNTPPPARPDVKVIFFYR
jgi:hypothetical protein